MSVKRVAAILVALFGTLLALGLAAAIMLASIDVRSLVETYASRSLERRVSLGALRIGWGNPITLELKDLVIANADWATMPEMVRIDGLSAEIAPMSLLSPPLRFEKLLVTKPRIRLERNGDRLGNWHMPAGRSAGAGRFSLVPRDRTEFPTLLDLALSEGEVVYRTTGGAELVMKLGALAIQSAGADAPVTLSLDGRYNGTPAKLTAKAESFARLRDAAVPFGMELAIASDKVKLAFKGGLAKPLDFDGANGRLDLESGDLGALLGIFGPADRAAFAAKVGGTLRREGDQWRIGEAKGAVAASAFTGMLELAEAPSGKPDVVSLVLDFPRLELDPILAGLGKEGGSASTDYRALPIRQDGNRSTIIDAKISASRAIRARLEYPDARLEGRLAPSVVQIRQLAFGFAGGRLEASGSDEAVPRGGHLVLDAGLIGADADAIARLLGAGPGEIAGPLDGRATVELTGATVGEGLAESHGFAVLTMQGGRVARSLLEKASADLLSLFRKAAGTSSLNCFLGIVELKNGTGRIAPLRLRTPEATLLGGGEVDLRGERLNLAIRSEGGSGRGLALDIPFRLSGRFSNLKAQPILGGAIPELEWTRRSPAVDSLPSKLQDLAKRNPCLG